MTSYGAISFCIFLSGIVFPRKCTLLSVLEKKKEKPVTLPWLKTNGLVCWEEARCSSYRGSLNYSAGSGEAQFFCELCLSYSGELRNLCIELFFFYIHFRSHFSVCIFPFFFLSSRFKKVKGIFGSRNVVSVHLALILNELIYKHTTD